MSRVLIVGRTRMRGDHVCIGGHDLDRSFRPIRLLDANGRNWPSAAAFQVGDLWDMRYRLEGAPPPHVEDVRVSTYKRLGRAASPPGLVMAHAVAWTGPPTSLFDGTGTVTSSGAAYIPGIGPVPGCSTGYWIPDSSLQQRRVGDRIRFEWAAVCPHWRFAWVGTQETPSTISAGSLVRVSLSRLFSSDTAPEGYYMQISGVLGSATDLPWEGELEIVRYGKGRFLASVPGLQPLIDQIRRTAPKGSR